MRGSLKSLVILAGLAAIPVALAQHDPESLQGYGILRMLPNDDVFTSRATVVVYATPVDLRGYSDGGLPKLSGDDVDFEPGPAANGSDGLGGPVSVSGAAFGIVCPTDSTQTVTDTVFSFYDVFNGFTVGTFPGVTLIGERGIAGFAGTPGYISFFDTADPTTIPDFATPIDIAVSGGTDAFVTIRSLDPGTTNLHPTNWVVTGGPVLSVGSSNPVRWGDSNGDGLVQSTPAEINAGNTRYLYMGFQGEAIDPSCIVPAVTVPPQPQTLCEGLGVVLSVTATGSNLQYQWRRDQISIAGATNSQFSVALATTSDSGTYDCVVSNDCGIATSSPAAVTVNATPQINTQPAAQQLIPGAMAVFVVGATGTNLTYQWRRNGINIVNGPRITGANQSTLSISGVQSSDQGQYDCVVSSVCTTTSVSAPLTCRARIIQQPLGGTFFIGQPFAISANVATGGPTIYRWRRNGSTLADNSIYSGTTTPTLVVNAIDPAQSGIFSLSVTNSCGVTITNDVLVDIVFPFCDSLDVNNDGSFFDPQDIEAFLSVYSEGPCIPSEAVCNDIDFNNDGSVFDPCDISSFLTVYSEGPCTSCGQ
jgi:hypothetical protein